MILDRGPLVNSPKILSLVQTVLSFPNTGQLIGQALSPFPGGLSMQIRSFKPRLLGMAGVSLVAIALCGAPKGALGQRPQDDQNKKNQQAQQAAQQAQR